MPYTTIPSYRIPYDRIGAVGFHSQAGVWSQLTQTQVNGLNSERFAGAGIEAGSDSNIYDGIVLPEPYDVRGWAFLATAKYPEPSRTMVIQTSVDSTTGQDGVWVTQGTPVAMPGYGSPQENYWRSNIVSVNLDGIRGLRIYRPDAWGGATGNLVYHLHVYGYPSVGFDTNRLEVWDSTLDQRASATALDWGDVARNTIEIRQVRIKNLSATQTANAVTVSATGINAVGTEATSQHSFSLDNITFTTSVSLGNLAPGAISPVIYVKRNTLTASPIGLYATRVTAVPASWS